MPAQQTGMIIDALCIGLVIVTVSAWVETML